MCSNGPSNWRSGRKGFYHRKLPKTLRVAIDRAARGRGTCRRHIQLAGPCGTQCGERCGRLARLERGPGLPSGGHSPAPGSRASSARSTSTGTMPAQRRRRSRPSRANSIRCNRGLLNNCPRPSRNRRSRSRSRPWCKSGRRIWSRIPRVARAFARAWRRIDGCRSRTRRCVTAARAKASGSMD